MVIAEPLRPLAVPLDDLRTLEGNPRRGDVAAVARSLRRFGQRKPVVARADGTVIAGNHLLAAARELGWSELAVTRVDDDDATAKAFALADNRTSELGSFDLGDLAAMAAEVHAVDSALLQAASYTEADLNALLAGEVVPAKLTDPDEVPEPPAEPVTRPGGLWLLGDNHRLLCGDNTAPEDLDRLTDGALADLVVTDPPFAIYGSSSGVDSDVADDKMVRPFFEAMWRTIHARLKEFGHAYVHCDWRSWASLWEAAKRGHMTPHNMIVWDKGGMGMGSHYGNTHELVAFFGKLPPQRTMTNSGPAGQRLVYRPNVLHVSRPSGDDRLHNAAKPVELLREFIKNSSDPGGVVLDLYAGSGSTLIAAHAEDRAAWLVEIEPATCDVVLSRYQEHTGTKPILEATGEPHDFTA